MSVHWRGVSKWQIEHFLLLPESRYYSEALCIQRLPCSFIFRTCFSFDSFSQRERWHVYKCTVYSYFAIQQHVYCSKASNLAASSSFSWCIHYGRYTKVIQSNFSLFFFFFFGCTWGTWKFPGQGWNLSHIYDLCHSCGNTGFLTHCARLGIKLAMPPRQERSLTHCTNQWISQKIKHFSLQDCIAFREFIWSPLKLNHAFVFFFFSFYSHTSCIWKCPD